MGFAQGLQAGMQLGRAYQEGQDRRRQEEFNRAVSATMQDYYQGKGDFGAQPLPAEDVAGAQARENASYDRVIERKAGVNMPMAQPDVMTEAQVPVQPNMGLRTPQQLEGAVGAPVTRGVQLPTGIPEASAEQGPSLSMSSRDVANARGTRPLDQTERAAKLYEKLAAASQFLPGEKAVAWQQNLERMRKENYLEDRKQLLTGLANGDKAALERFAPIYNKQYPDGWEVDTSAAKFENGSWVGIKARKGDQSKDITLGENEMMKMYFMTDLDKAAAYGFKLKDEGRKDRAEGRADRAENRADRQVQLAEDAGARDSIRLGLAAQKQADDAKNDRARIAQGWAQLNLGQERLKLEKDIKAGDENAKDSKLRLDTFIAEFAPGVGKLDPASPTFEEDKAKTESGRRAASLAYSVYSLSAEGAAPKERNALAAEASQFVREFAAGKADPSKLVDNGDGTVSYGRLKLPASLVKPSGAQAPAPAAGGVRASAPAPAPGLKPEQTTSASGAPLFRYPGQTQWYPSTTAAIAAMGQRQPEAAGGLNIDRGF